MERRKKDGILQNQGKSIFPRGIKKWHIVVIGIISVIAIGVSTIWLILNNRHTDLEIQEAVSDSLVVQDNSQIDFTQEVTAEDGGQFIPTYQQGNDKNFTARFVNLACTSSCTNVSDVRVNDRALQENEDYVIGSGSVVITLKESFLASLGSGNYKLTFTIVMDSSEKKIGLKFEILSTVTCNDGEQLIDGECHQIHSSSSSETPTLQVPIANPSNSKDPNYYYSDEYHMTLMNICPSEIPSDEVSYVSISRYLYALGIGDGNMQFVHPYAKALQYPFIMTVQHGWASHREWGTKDNLCYKTSYCNWNNSGVKYASRLFINGRWYSDPELPEQVLTNIYPTSYSGGACGVGSQFIFFDLMEIGVEVKDEWGGIVDEAACKNELALQTEYLRWLESEFNRKCGN